MILLAFHPDNYFSFVTCLASGSVIIQIFKATLKNIKMLSCDWFLLD